MRTADIKTFASEHYPDRPSLRVEWIDDTSANVVYETAEMAASALAAFSLVDSEKLPLISSLQLRAAKPLSTRPEAKLEVRLAVAQDRKQPGARERSRFYLFNPEEDRGEQRHRDKDRRPRGRPNRDDEHGDYRRRRYDRREQDRRRNGDEDGGFDAKMYDDDAGSSGKGMSPTRSERARERRQVRFDHSANGRELFPGRAGRGRDRSRDRSASPDRRPRGDDSMDVDDVRARQRRFRQRSRSPRDRHRPRRVDSGTGQQASTMDVSASDQALPRDIAAELRGHAKPTRDGMELFPQKTNVRQHRRSDAFDAADETADLFAGRMSVPFTDGPGDRRGASSSTTKFRNSGILAEDDGGRSKRLTPPAMDVAEHTRQAPSGAMEEATQEAGGFQIRGAAAGSTKQGRDQGKQGFSIRGAASSGATSEAVTGANGNGTRVKELFPQKKQTYLAQELFSEKLQGRGRRRRKAEDMFY